MTTDLIPEGELQTALFQDTEVQGVFHENEWYFSIVDVIAAITGSASPRTYWSKLKANLVKEGKGADELNPIWVQLKMPSSDGKVYLRDAANTEALFRIIQSVPSPRAERFKRWLAKVATTGFWKSRIRRSRSSEPSSITSCKVVRTTGLMRGCVPSSAEKT